MELMGGLRGVAPADEDPLSTPKLDAADFTRTHVIS